METLRFRLVRAGNEAELFGRRPNPLQAERRMDGCIAQFLTPFMLRPDPSDPAPEGS